MDAQQPAFVLTNVSLNRGRRRILRDITFSVPARAVAAQPTLLLLDEPTAGLDLLAREQVLATVESLFERHRPPLTAVLITHHIEELPPATSQVLVLDDGQLAAAGSPAQVLTSSTLSKVYKCPLTVEHRHNRFTVHVNPHSWT